MFNKKTIKDLIILVIKIMLITALAKFINEITNIPETICLLTIPLILYKKGINLRIKFNRSYKGIFIIISVIFILQYLLNKVLFYLEVDYVNLYFNYIVIIDLFLFKLINASIEEFVFRVFCFEYIKLNIINNQLNIINNQKVQIIFSSLVFAVYHIIYMAKQFNKENFMLIFPILLATFIGGICFGYIYNKTNNFIYVTLIHCIYNFNMNITTLKFDFNSLSNISIGLLYGYMATVSIIIMILYKLINKKKSFKELIA